MRQARFEDINNPDKLLIYLREIAGLIDPKAKTTPEGGFAVRMTNRTGAISVKGTIVRSSTSYDSAVMTAPADSDEAIGVIYDNGVPDGQEVFVVVGGLAQVLLKNSTTATRGYWVQVSNVAGRADATLSDPNPATHWDEIGHCMENKAAGTNVLALVNLHFN